MDSKSQYEEFKKAIEELKRAAREEYERRVQALDTALAVAEEIGMKRPPDESAPIASVTTIKMRGPSTETVADEMQPPTTEQHSMWEDSPERNGGSKPFKLKDEVIRAYRQFNGEQFRQKDVTRIVRERHTDQTVYSGSVTSTLMRLVDQGELHLVKPAGGGSDPAVFQEVRVPA